MIALIDADIVVYKATASLDTPDEMIEPGLYRFDYPVALMNAKEFCKSIVEQTGADDAILCFTSTFNYRKEIIPTYKGNRVSRKPIMYSAVKEEIQKWARFRSLTKIGLEADDVLGILHTGPLAGESVICTIDKDLRTVPGLHFNWDKEFNGVEEVSEDEADRAFYEQIITGDHTDGYSGAVGWGPKKAKELLDQTERSDWWETIVNKPYKGDFDAAIETARVARILRADEFDTESRSPILWEPPA